MRMTRTTMRAALAGVVVSAGIAVPAAALDFIPRETAPQDCDGLAALRGPGNVWFGRFHGSKELEHGFFGADSPGERRVSVSACFADETNCKNWLYNHLSEYRRMVWTSECRLGLPG